jgi:hypothetical protein
MKQNYWGWLVTCNRVILHQQAGVVLACLARYRCFCVVGIYGVIFFILSFI